MEIVNIVATVETEKKFDLEAISYKLPNSKLYKRWVKIRLPSNDRYIAFYKNCKFLITGAKSETEVFSIANETIAYLNKYGIINKIIKINITNYVLISQLDFKINLEELIINLWEYDASYEPEQFPALKFKDYHGITYLLFSSGKVTITGVKSLDNIEGHISEFKDLIREKSHV